MNTVIVNGVKIEIPDGQSINVVSANGNVVINGKNVHSGGGQVTLKVEGDVGSIRTDGDVECLGVKGDIDAGGSIKCQDVGGGIDAGGSVVCNNVKGDIDAGGSITAGDVEGDIDAGGGVVVRSRK